MKKTHYFSFQLIDCIALILIIITAFLFRLYKVNTPLADLHSWRQVDTAAVARNFVRGGFDLLYPRYDDLTSIESGKENPNGYRFVEFPFYNAIFAYEYKLVPLFPIEVYGRVTTALFSLLLIASIYYLCLKESGRITAVAASLVYAVFPFFVFFSRVVLPDTTAVSLMFLSLFFLYCWSNSKRISTLIPFYLFSMILFSLALLTKPMVVFYGIGLLFLFWRKYKLSFFKYISFYLFFILSIIPFLLWRYHISFYPEGIPASSWLIALVNTYEGQKNIFFKPAFFRWIFYERISNFMLGGYGVSLLALGLGGKTKKYFLHVLMAAGFAFVFTFQGGNVQHEYYQTILLPAIAIGIGLGIQLIIQNLKNTIHPVLTTAILSVVLIFSVAFSYYKVKDYYSYPNDLVQIAKIISTLTKPQDKIITDRMGDTTLLYLADRKGSPATYKSLEDFKKDDYRYFVTAQKETISQIKLQKTYKIIFENDQFALIRL